MADDSLIGTSIGNYEVKSRLGAGAMGEVYLGEHPQIGRRVAIKVLVAQLSASEEMSDRFLSEARAVNKITHPNIIQIFDFGRLPNGRLYYTMEFLDGEELTQLIKKRAPLSVTEAGQILAQVVGALDAAHGAGIVHRDLKPDNIIVTDSPAGPVVKVLDFGIAKLLEPDLQSRQKTSTGMIMGTPMYMSPEQAAGQVNDISPRSDIYALGVILYQMLSGRVPFEAPTAAQLLAAHITEPPKPLSEVTEGLPEAVHQVVERSLEKSPDARQQSASQLYTEYSSACSTLPGGFTATVAAGAADPSYPVLVGSGAGSRPGYGSQPGASGAPHYGSQPGASSAPNYGSQPGSTGQPGYSSEPGAGPIPAASDASQGGRQPTTLGQSASQITTGIPGRGGSRAVLIGLFVVAAVGIGVAVFFATRGNKEPDRKEAAPTATAMEPVMEPPREVEPPVMQAPPVPVVKVHQIQVKARTRRVRVEVTVAGQRLYAKRPPFAVDAKTGERVTLRAYRPGYTEQVESLVATRSQEIVFTLHRGSGRVVRRPRPRPRPRPVVVRVRPRPRPRPRPRLRPRPVMRRYGESTISPFPGD